MHNFGVRDAIGVVLLLGGIVVPLWFGLRAKPLGAQPYRWATWLSLQSILLSAATVPTALKSIIAQGPEFGPVYLWLITGLAIGGAVGVLRRKRAGVVCLVASEALTFLMAPLLSMSPLANAVNEGAPPVPVLGVLIANCIYFRRRWTLLGAPDERPEAVA